MGDFKVESGIPIPEVIEQRASAYPWTEMEVGDSFYAPVRKEGNDTVSRVRNRVNQARANAKKKYGIDTIINADHEGVRVWRIK